VPEFFPYWVITAQGWTAVAEWAGVPLARLIQEARPARYVVFCAMDDTQ
jgi:DMSO/TMAO reductase YedYZ molybdopterin-dependent catalytic subunit